MCRNHVTAIPNANHAQLKYFRSRDVYDTYYDEVVRVSFRNFWTYIPSAITLSIRQKAGVSLIGGARVFRTLGIVFVCIRPSLACSFIRKLLYLTRWSSRFLQCARSLGRSGEWPAQKRKNYLAAKALETRKGFVKSKLLRIVGPMVRAPTACR